MKEDFLRVNQLQEQISKKLPFSVRPSWPSVPGVTDCQSSAYIKVKQVPLFCRGYMGECCCLGKVRLLAVGKFVHGAVGSQLPIHVGDDEGFVCCIVLHGLCDVPDEWANWPLVSFLKLKIHAPNSSLLDMQEVNGNISVWHGERDDCWLTPYPYSKRQSKDFCSMRRALMCTFYGWIFGDVGWVLCV